MEDERERFFGAISPVWLPQYESGRRALDDQHRSLIAGFGEVIRTFRDETDLVARASAYNRLVVECSNHFAYEEALLAAARYPGLDHHRLMDASLLDRALGLLAQLSSTSSAPLEVAVSRLAELIVLHMVVEDRKFFPHLRAGLQHGPDDQGHRHRDRRAEDEH